MKRLVFAAMLVALSAWSNLMSFAQVPEPRAPWTAKDPLRGLCTIVSTIQEDDTIGGRYMWAYQRQLLIAANVDITADDEETVARKIREVWEANKHRFQCSSASFDIPRGNIIKFAVNAKFDHFIDDMVNWGIELNDIDEYDQRTVLDYIEHQIQRNQGSSIERRLRGYYDLLRKAGALHLRELPDRDAGSGISATTGDD